MNLSEINKLIKDYFGKPLHIELKLSLKEDSYTNEFIKYYNKRLKGRVIALEHLIKSEIDNNRWIVNDDCNLVMLSIPFLDNTVKCVTCLNSSLHQYLCKKDFDTLDMFFHKIEGLYNLDICELYASMLHYNSKQKIQKNMEQLTNACYKEQQQWYL
jgi:hypothetical protein